MKTSTLTTTAVAALVWTAGSAIAADQCCPTTTTTAQDQCAGENIPVALAHPDELFMHELAGHMIHSLTLEEQIAIKKAGGIGSHTLHFDPSHFTYEVDRSATAHLPRDITPSEYRDFVVSDELDARLTDNQRHIIDSIVETLEAGKQPPMLCFSPDTDPEVAFAINQLIEFRYQIAFQQTGRWNNTATDGTGLGQGDPTTLTYSYVPDGTFVPNLGIGLGSGSSQLFAWLNGIYGSPSNWQPLFDGVFDRWSELTGLSYVYEPNDDGANTNGAGGVLGVRGDVRIAAFNFQNDGNGGVLAYNNFPQDGDMVFDAFDSFYNVTGSNSLRLRNVISHEHGHGLGMLHVCPANGTKLMEPFLSTSFDGPQLDDILNGQRHYGDPNEPNNSLAQTTDLGNVQVGTILALQNLSIDDNSDSDFFEINLTEPAELIIGAAPAAATYQQGPQTSQCNTGTNTNYNTIHNLRVSIYSPDDLFNPQASADDTSAGQSEFLTYEAVQAGTYWIEIDASSSTNSIQRYSFSFVANDLPFLGPILSADEPESVDPGVTTDFNVTIDPRDDTLVGTPQLFTSVNGGSYTSTDLVSAGGNNFTATLPAVNCDDTVEFYIQAEGDTEGTITLPEGGASAPFSAFVGELQVVLDDNFETDTGWLVSGSVTSANSGRWQRGVPAAGGDDRVSDPAEDFDGSGQCYVTGNVSGNSDVDGGDTVLTSPLLELADSPEAMVSYARWFDNNEGGTAAEAFTETFVVEISNNNGGSWTQLEEVGPTGPEVSGGWFVKEFRVADFVTPTDQVRVRFIAEDQVGTIVEAGVDAFNVSGLSCEDPMTDCAPDLTMDGSLDFFDVSALISGSVDYNGDTSFDFFDISEFLQDFDAGCP